MSRSFLASMAVAGALVVTVSAADNSGVKITEQPDKLRIEINGEHFTDYCFQGAPHVYFYPLLGPGGAKMTRNWPMEDITGEEHDHPHHRSLWYSHGAVNGVDFWSESAKSGRIVHDKFLEVKSGADSGVIRSTCKWIAPGGETTMTDERVFRVYARPGSERLFDFEVTLKAGERDIVLGDTKEGTMAVRLNESMRGMLPKKPGEKKTPVGKGRIAMSTGAQSNGEGDDRAWGKRAEWCDYSGPVDGKTVGIAIFDHPSNPKHPTWWHVREYGLFAANPFGVHEFEKQPPGAGNLTIEAKKSVTFKYRFLIHEGDEKQAKVAERYKEYSEAK
ncbi:MAG TPA: PmoA family protein [Verrucomicrobiae bacterium]|nr:PmoA family protein [Verrucomicrobiae bacterium]